MDVKLVFSTYFLLYVNLLAYKHEYLIIFIEYANVKNESLCTTKWNRIIERSMN